MRLIAVSFRAWSPIAVNNDDVFVREAHGCASSLATRRCPGTQIAGLRVAVAAENLAPALRSSGCIRRGCRSQRARLMRDVAVLVCSTALPSVKRGSSSRFRGANGRSRAAGSGGPPRGETILLQRRYVKFTLSIRQVAGFSQLASDYTSIQK